MFRRPGRGRLLLLVFLALSTVLITLDFRSGEGGPLETARDVTAAIVAPIQRGFTKVFRPVGDFFSSLGDLGELKDENDQLTEQVDRMEREIDAARSALADNESLKDELELKKSWFTMETVTAELIARVTNNYRWAYTVDKGSDDGIEKGMAVIEAEGLVGHIVEVGPHESTVLLMIDPLAAAGARIRPSRDTGTVQGNGANRDLELNFVPGEARAHLGNLVVTSGYDDGIFPPGIPIGNISAIEGQSSDLQQDISVRPAVDFNALDYVTVLLETGPQLRDPSHKGNKPTRTAQGGGD